MLKQLLMHFTDCRLYTMFSFCEQKYWYTGQEEKTQKWKWDIQLKAHAITHPRNGEQETVKMVRMCCRRRGDRMSWSGSQVGAGDRSVGALEYLSWDRVTSATGITPQTAALGKLWSSQPGRHVEKPGVVQESQGRGSRLQVWIWESEHRDFIQSHVSG